MPRLSDREIAGVCKQVGFTGNDLNIAIAVALAESSGNPTATNQNTDEKRSVDYGLFQINGYWNAQWLRQGDWRNPVDNARMAYSIWKARGWRDWVTYKNGRYRMFLGRASLASGNPTMPGGTTVQPIIDTPALGPLTAFPAFISDAANWRRLGMFSIGVLLLIIAFFKMTGDNQLSGFTKGIAKVAVTKKL